MNGALSTPQTLTIEDIRNEILNQRVEFVRNCMPIDSIKLGGQSYSILLASNAQEIEYDHKHLKHKFMGIDLVFDSKLNKDEIFLESASGSRYKKYWIEKEMK